MLLSVAILEDAGISIILRVFVKFLNSSAQIGNNRDQNNYLLKTCYTASCEVAGTQIEIAE